MTIGANSFWTSPSERVFAILLMDLAAWVRWSAYLVSDYCFLDSGELFEEREDT